MKNPVFSKRIAEKFNLSNRSEFVRLATAKALSNITVCTSYGRVESITEREARLVILEGKNVYADVLQSAGGFSDASQVEPTVQKEYQKQ